MNVRRRLLAAVAAAVLAGAVAGTASAGRLSWSSQNLRMTWSAMTFIASEELGIMWSCPVTLEGSFHARTMVKTVNALIGYITRAAIAPAPVCTGGQATVLSETLPWHFRYAAFTGTLPNITTTTLNIVGESIFFDFPAFGIRCLYRSTAAEPIRLRFAREAGGTISSVTNEGRYPTTSGFPCPPMAGGGTTSNVTVLGAATRVTLTLI